ncbi:hypothetical protein BDF22DRAFT_438935 [Syncephalis plumigaleata]|nr:hypothetical protein BDF22DRAFT_438935 [Syncephalis plumigaleata]
MIEDIVLSVARDYFNNADTGDKYAGLMKKAILCLEILPITDKVQKEWDLIDIAYDVYRYAPQMAPVQIRYAPSRERLISLLISDNLQIYEQITRPISNLISAANSLLDKLGCQSQVAAQLVMFTSLLQWP